MTLETGARNLTKSKTIGHKLKAIKAMSQMALVEAMSLMAFD